jgi:hypothetical protein
MMRFVCFGLLLALITLNSGIAQADEVDLGQAAKVERTARNSLYVELGGNAGLYSVNYERFVMDDAALRIGLMYMSVSASTTAGGTTSTGNASWFGAPLMFSYMGVGSRNHKLELGAGVVLMNFSAGASTFSATSNASGFVVAGTATVGYRYVPVDGGFNFKAGFTPLVLQAAGTLYFQPWAGISVGYGF